MSDRDSAYNGPAANDVSAEYVVFVDGGVPVSDGVAADGSGSAQGSGSAEPVSPFKRSNTLFSSFFYAGIGIGTAFRERNFKIDCTVAALALVLAALLHAPAWGWAVIVVCIGVQLCAETFNTAIEAVVDLASPGYHKLAKRAKDCAAGAALVTAIMSVVAGLVVYGYSIWVLVGA